MEIYHFNLQDDADNVKFNAEQAAT